MTISVCMALYSRPQMLPQIKEALKKQTFQDFEFLVWDNTKDNQGSKARFQLVKKAKGDLIVFIDDDEIPHPDFLKYMHNQAIEYPKHVLGWFTRIFNYSYRNAITYSKTGTEVDYVGTGGMIVDRMLFDGNSVLYDIPEECAKAEDLFLSYIARQNGYKLRAVDCHLDMIKDGKNQCADLWDYKEKAFTYLKKMGWHTLND